jgi:hypothetical protein
MIGGAMKTVRRMANFIKACITVFLATASMLAQAQIVIDFEDLPAGGLGIPIQVYAEAQYGARGVLFQNAAAIDYSAGSFAITGFAHSGTKAVTACYAVEFCTAPITMSFRTPQTRVKVWAGYSDGGVIREDLNRIVQMRAFDAAGQEVGRADSPPFTLSAPQPVPVPIRLPLEVASGSANIVRAEVHLLDAGGAVAVTNDLAIDDVEFDAAPPPGPPAPVVAITAPSSGTVNFTSSGSQVTGTVSGAQILSTTLRIMPSEAPGSTTPPFVREVSLVPTGQPNQYTFTVNLEALPQMGRTVITVTSVNVGGLSGSASVEVFNAVPEIAQQCGPTQPRGQLLYSVALQACSVAVCAQGGVSTANGAVRYIPPTILQKWLQVPAGCPTRDAIDAEGGGQQQDFERVRIFNTRVGGGVFYTPKVFADAIDTLGGQAATGLPVSDPQSFVGVAPRPPTWSFQRFRRPGAPSGTLDSTLEIRGDNPVLSVERQGGDLSEFNLAELTLSAGTPTIWQTFPCEVRDGDFVCHVSPPTSGPPLADANRNFCGSPLTGALPREFPWVPKQWVAVEDDHANTPVLGWIRARSPDLPGATGSHAASGDNPLVHEHKGGPPSWPSDWNLHLVLLQPYWDRYGENFKEKNFEVEIESYFVNYFFVSTDFPHAGDLVFANGRWIVDCGHTSGNTEIHPPSVLAFIRGEQDVGSRPVTRADIYVNGFFNGQDVEFDLHPPPRPSPTARLVLSKPVDEFAALGLTVEYDFLTDHIRPRFFGAPRQNTVTRFGEMKWLNGRAYYGTWRLYWAE